MLSLRKKIKILKRCHPDKASSGNFSGIYERYGIIVVLLFFHIISSILHVYSLILHRFFA